MGWKRGGFETKTCLSSSPLLISLSFLSLAHLTQPSHAFIYNKPAAKRPAAPSNPTSGAPDATAPPLLVVVAPEEVLAAEPVELPVPLAPLAAAEVVRAPLALAEPEAEVIEAVPWAMEPEAELGVWANAKVARAKRENANFIVTWGFCGGVVVLGDWYWCSG